jgi:hypothetical protein
MSRIEGGAGVRQVEFEQPKQVVKAETVKADSNVETQNLGTKAAELSFTGVMMAAKVNSRPTQVTQNYQTNGGNTEANYRVGNPTRPNIRHDNGFRQNPNDPNDTTLRPTIQPNQRDRDFYNDQLFQARAAQVAEDLPVPFTDRDNEARRLEDGIDAYLHFLQGNGRDRNFSYDEFVSEDTAGRTVLNNAIADTQRGVENLYSQMIARDSQFPYPATENWQKAIGGHTIWNSATVTVTPPSTPGGRPTFSMDYTLHAEDRYNFNPGQNDIATGAPDSLRGRLEMTGLAHQYMNYGSSSRDVTWTQGNIQTSTRVTNGR